MGSKAWKCDETCVVFLDIDGTLNKLRLGSPDFEPSCVAAFNRIIDATGAAIVLSSSWRYKICQGHTTLAGMQAILESNGVNGVLIDCTRADEGDEPRWMQIRDWLKHPPVKVRRYCILDDDADAFGNRPGVRTNCLAGLTEKDADAAIEILLG